MKSDLGKILYVAGVAMFCTFLGCWAVLAHQENTSAARAAVPPSEARFARKAAQGGMAEVKLGQLAQEKGSSEAVKRFGARMVLDHTKAGEDLKLAAQKEHLALPSEMDDKDQMTYNSLSNLAGPAFDRAYARDMVKDHQGDIADFQKEADSGRDDAIKNFASAALPTLQDHLNEAKEMLRSVSPASGNRSGGHSR